MNIKNYFKFKKQENYIQDVPVIKNLLLQLGKARIMAVTGVSGVGKTSLVNELSHIMSKGYTVRWFQFFPKGEQDHPYLVDTYKQEAIKLYPQIGKMSNQKFLFVYDDVEDFEYVKELTTNLPRNLLVLITTKLNEVPNYMGKIELKNFTRDEKKEFLNALITKPMDSLCKSIVDTVVEKENSLPIELSCVAAFVNNYEILKKMWNDGRLDFYCNDFLKHGDDNNFASSLLQLFCDYRTGISGLLTGFQFPKLPFALKNGVRPDAANKDLVLVEKLNLVTRINLENDEETFVMHDMLKEFTILSLIGSYRVPSYRKKASDAICTGNYKLALQYFKRLIQFTSHENPVSMSLTLCFYRFEIAEFYAYAGLCSSYLGNKDEGFNYFQKSRQITEQICEDISKRMLDIKVTDKKQAKKSQK